MDSARHRRLFRLRKQGSNQLLARDRSKWARRDCQRDPGELLTGDAALQFIGRQPGIEPGHGGPLNRNRRIAGPLEWPRWRRR